MNEPKRFDLWRSIRRMDRRYVWILVFLLTLLVRAFSGQGATEAWYSRGFFLAFRQFWDVLFGWLPIPIFYILLLWFLLWLSSKTYYWWRWRHQFWPKVGSAALTIGSFLAGLITFFLWMWGFNYGRIPLEQQIAIHPKPLSLEQLKAEYQRITDSLHVFRPQLGDTTALDSIPFRPEILKDTLRQSLEEQLRAFDYPVVGKVQARTLKPDGILLRLSTSGVYLPWTGEGHVDGGLHALQLPFVLAHEMAHGYGIADEGSCNFLAYLSCYQHSDPYIRYVGYLGYWRYLASSYRGLDPEAYREAYDHIPRGVLNDIQSIYRQMNRFPDVLPRFRNAFYDSYLKVQGVKEGIKSYSRILMLVHAWEEKLQEVEEKK